MKHVHSMTDAIREVGEKSINERGNTIWRSFHPSSRYVIDFADDFKTSGWEQYDTNQDAEYFGVWVHREKLLTLTYAEGDWALVECPDVASFNAEIEDANRVYAPGFIAKTWGESEGWIEYQQDRQQFYVGVCHA